MNKLQKRVFIDKNYKSIVTYNHPSSKLNKTGMRHYNIFIRVLENEKNKIHLIDYVVYILATNYALSVHSCVYLNLNLNRENVYINNLNSDFHSILADNNKEMQGIASI